MLRIYTGPMFSGKTTLLIAEAQVALEEKKTAVAIKPNLDTRFDCGDIITHDGNSFWENTAAELLDLPADFNFTNPDFISKISGFDLVLIDEVQFFENVESIVELSQEWDFEVVCSGLDLDSSGKPFGKMPLLLSYAQSVHKCHGTCASCGGISTRTSRNSTNSSIILVGGSDMYEPKCYSCWKMSQLSQQSKAMES